MIWISCIQPRFVFGKSVFKASAVCQWSFRYDKAILESIADDFGEIGIDCEAGGTANSGTDLDLLQFQAATLGNLNRLIENVRDLAET